MIGHVTQTIKEEVSGLLVSYLLVLFISIILCSILRNVQQKIPGHREPTLRLEERNLESWYDVDIV